MEEKSDAYRQPHFQFSIFNFQFRVACGVAAILLIHVLGRTGAYCSPVRTDSYVFSSFGYRMANGDVMYRDMSDAKPPGMFLLNAAVYLVAPGGRASMIPVESLLMLLGYFVVYKAARELYGPGVGMILTIAAALAINLFLLTDYTIEGFNLAENYMVLASATAVLYYLTACRSGRGARWFLCGLFLGLGFVLKQTVLPLALAVALHHTLFSLLIDRRPRHWACSSVAMALGACAALLPFVLFLAAQGTLTRAAAAIVAQAAGHLTRETAWPGRWNDVQPVWVPMGWCAIGLTAWAGWRVAGGRADRNGPGSDPRSLPPALTVAFLLLWLALECVMLVYLPRRAFHYYVLTCLPLILLSGLMWAVLLRTVREVPESTARVVLAGAAIWSIAFVRPAIDTFVPTVIARYQTYDADADRAFFESALKWGNLDIG